MKKRIICLLLAVTMIVGLIPAAAGAEAAGGAGGGTENPSVDIKISSILEKLDKVESLFLSLSAEKRAEYFNLIKVYLTTNDGIDDLINAVNNPSTLPALANYESQIENYKEEIIFILKLIKSISENNRQTALNVLALKTSYTGFSTTGRTSLNNTYALLLDADTREALETYHSISALVLANFVKELLNGEIVLTNKTSDQSNIKIKSISTSFKEKIKNNLNGYVVNGTRISTADNFFDVIFNEFYSTTALKASEKNDIVRILIDLKLYEVSSVTPGPNPGGGGGGGSVINPPKNDTETGKGDDGEEQGGGTETKVPVPTTTTTFSDATEHWANNYIGFMQEKNIMGGYDDGTFKPNQSITRQEVAAILVRALGLEDELGTITETDLVDAEEIADWAVPYVLLLKELGIFGGYEDGTFRPEVPITREQFAVIISNAMKLPPAEDEINFTDNGDISDWALVHVKRCVAAGIINGYDDNSFKPKNEITRAEAAVMLYRFMYTEGYVE